MGDVVHTSRIVITREKGPTRKAMIEGFAEPVYYGVHGGIKNFYKVDPEKEHAATLDHIVGAVGGWMMGTLATVLAGKKIPTYGDRFRADVEGDVEDVGGVLKITRIRVKYTLKVPPGKTGETRQSLGEYLVKCPAAMSVKGAIDLIDSAEITELDA
jgi:hypothetical protein